MNTIVRALLSVSRPFSSRMSPCELNGMLIGVIAGTIFSAIWFSVDSTFTPVAAPLWLYLALVMAAFCWMLLFGLLCGPLHYAPSTVAGPLLINALMTSVLTIYLCNLSAMPSVFFLFGILVGLLVGRLLCRFCRQPARNVK